MEDLRDLTPDIVIADLLMPVMDGLTFVEEARKSHPQLAFIMLSQVSSKDMIADAYEKGIEFLFQKPVNSVELETVIKKVSASLSMNPGFSQDAEPLPAGGAAGPPGRRPQAPRRPPTWPS